VAFCIARMLRFVPSAAGLLGVVGRLRQVFFTRSLVTRNGSPKPLAILLLSIWNATE
jgi:hypothetical protein